jgi:4-hydroxy-tetrahydrodipicolinate synthase
MLLKSRFRKYPPYTTKINSKYPMIAETYTALVTPFKNNKIDEKSLEKLVEFQIKNGVSGIVPCGTTGESPTLSHKEHNLVIELCVKIANGRVKIMAGTGSNSTDEAVEMTKHAKKVGADSCLIVAPYYNKPTAEGIYQHYKALDKCGIPLYIYNVPGRSVINISDQNLARLSELKNVVGIKDATGDLARVATMRLAITKKFSFLSGEDVTAVGYNAMGGNGVISVTSNIAPKLVSNLQKATEKGDYKTALKIQDQLTALHDVMFCETNPIPVKYAASLMGLCSPETRLPLVTPSDAAKAKIKVEMIKLKLI